MPSGDFSSPRQSSPPPASAASPGSTAAVCLPPELFLSHVPWWLVRLRASPGQPDQGLRQRELAVAEGVPASRWLREGSSRGLGHRQEQREGDRSRHRPPYPGLSCTKRESWRRWGGGRERPREGGWEPGGRGDAG